MKKLLLSLLGLGTVACQQASRPASRASTAPAGASLAAEAATYNATLAPPAPAPDTTRTSNSPADTTEVKLARHPLTDAAAMVLLTRHQLADFWRDKDGSDEVPPLDGFFGVDYQRISIAFTRLRPDSLDPALLHVAGKTRFRKTVTPFVGELHVGSIARLVAARGKLDLGLFETDEDEDEAFKQAKLYTATATFSLREDSTVAGAGEFTGTAHLDFLLKPHHAPYLAEPMFWQDADFLPTKGAGVLYKGRWTSYQGTTTRPLLLSGNVFATAPPALTNFALGDRDPSFNPKYAKLGWNEYWANDEWWADPAKPTISL